MQKTGHPHRPRKIGEILDLTFRVYRDHFRTFAGVGVVLSLLSMSVGLVFNAVLMGGVSLDGVGLGPADMMARMLLAYPFFIGMTIVVQAIAFTLVIALVDDAVEGRSLHPWPRAKELVWRLPGAIVTFGLLGVGVMAGFFCCLLPGIYLWLAWSLAMPVFLLEGRSHVHALARSHQLVMRRGGGTAGAGANWVRVLVVGLVTGLVVYALSFLAQAPLFLVGVLAALQDHTPQATALGPAFLPLWIQLPLQFLGAVLGGLFHTLWIIPYALLYHDIRTRHEGLDLEQRLDRLEQSGSPSLDTP